MNGVLVIDKPAGPTSHDVVSAVRKAVGTKKVGHTGTLDPVATGVLPLVLGQATKVARYLTGSNKKYEAVVRLGQTTDTLDGEGEVLSEAPVDVTEAQVREAVQRFVGDIDQLPPMYSAKKVQGKRLYELARQGVEVEREAKRVTIFDIEILEVRLPDVRLSVHCSAGTYVRVLAADLGEALGCGGHLFELRRTAVGPFTLDAAVDLEELAEHPALARERMVPLSQALIELPRIHVPAEIARMVASGHQLSVADLRTLDTPDFGSDVPLTLARDDGELVAVARSLISSAELATTRRDKRALKTERVLTPR